MTQPITTTDTTGGLISGTLQQPRTQAERRTLWLADRRTCVTATDVGKLFNVGRGGPMAVWLDKTKKLPKEQADNPAMRFGRRFERPILEEYADRMQTPLQFADSFTMMRVPNFPLLGATLDAQRMDDWRPVDAKNIGFRSDEYGEAGSDVIPLSYALQLSVQMMVTQRDLADLAVLFNRYEFVPYTVHRDVLVEERIMEVVTDFWERHVRTDIPPEVDGSEEYTSWISRRFARQASKTFVRATPVEHSVALSLNGALADMATIEEHADALKNKLKLAIGEAGGIEGPTWKATWTQAKPTRKVDHEAVARALAEELAQGTAIPAHEILHRYDEQFTTEKEGSRRFTFTMKGDK